MGRSVRLLLQIISVFFVVLPEIAHGVQDFVVEGRLLGPSPPLLRYPGPDEYILPDQITRFTWNDDISQHKQRARDGAPRDMQSELKDYEPDFYQFELLDDDHELLWKTQTKKAFLELLDVPPSSYRRLKTGTYFWQIRSAVHQFPGNPKDAVVMGPPAKTRFFISKNALIQKKQPKFELGFGLFGGSFFYDGHSGITTAHSKGKGPAGGLTLFARGWFSRHWGAGFEGSFLRFQMPAIEGDFSQANLEGLWRTQLTVRPTGLVKGYGTWTALGLGLNFRHELQMDSLSARNYPWSVGPRLRWVLAHDWNAFTGAFLDLSVFTPILTFPGGGRNDSIGTTQIRPTSFDLTSLVFKTFRGGVKLGLGVKSAFWRSQYFQTYGLTSNQTIQIGPYGQLSVVF